ncbi:unnamed protein product [Closterium sp. NIES-54]
MAPPLPFAAAAAAAPAAATGTPALLSPAASVTAPAVAGGTPALPSPGAAVTPPLLSPAATATAPAAALVTPPVLSPAAVATAPAAAGGNPAQPSPGVAVTPLLSPAATATAPAAALVTPLLSPAAAATGPSAAVTPPLLSPAAAVAPPLLSRAAGIETAPAAAAVVPSQNAHAPPSPARGDAAHGTRNIQCAVETPDVPGAKDVGAASARAKHRSSKGKGGKGGRGGSGSGGGGSSGGSGGGGGGGGGGTGVGGVGSGGGGGGSGGSGGSGGGGTGGGRTGAPRRDFDVILSAMYALSVSAEGDYYWCVPPDPGIAAAALCASESCTLPGTALAEALHTFTLDLGASRCFFRDSTTLTPLPAPIPVRLADPSGGPVVARSSTVLPSRAVPSSSLSGLHLPSFSMNMVSTAALQDAMVTTTTPGGQRVSICTCTWTGRHLATFTRQPRSSLYTLATEPQVAASAQVSA